MGGGPVSTVEAQDMNRIVLPVALLALVAAAPLAAAAEVQSTVVLHDLNDPTTGAYKGCHVTNTALSTYTFSVTQGDRLVLTVKGSDENPAENRHTLSVEGVDGETQPVGPGESTTFEFAADKAGSMLVLCDGVESTELSGKILVRPAETQSDSTNGTPALGILGAAAALGLALAARRRS